MDVDRDAPVLGTAEIEVAASPQTVWEVLGDIESWPTWNPDVRKMALSGEVAPGSQFRWKAGGVTISSVIEAVDPPGLIGWTGRTIGLMACHVYRFEPRGEGTFVSTEESYDGWAARLFRKPIQRMLDKALEDGLGYLKAEAERRADPLRRLAESDR
jgi:uncharacterized protein YndB with AHSA1/START domain